MKPRAYYLVGLLVLMLAWVPSLGLAQGAMRVHIDYIDNSKFPQVDTYLSVADGDGLPVESLTQDMFTETEDGQAASLVDFSSIQKSAQPLAVALLMDTSASMWSKVSPTPLQKSVEEAGSFIDQLGQSDQVTIIQFSDQASTVFPLGSDKYTAKQALGKLQPGQNQRAQYDAMVEGVNALKGFSGRQVIVIVTNGPDTGLNEVHSLDGALTAAQNAGIPVYVMGFGNALSLRQLDQVADGTGGFAYIRQDQFGLQSEFDSLLRLLNDQYRLRYVSSLQANNSEHTLEVAVKDNGEEDRTSAHFISRSSTIPVSMPALHDGDVVGGIVSFVPTVNWPSAAVKSLDFSVDGVTLKTISAAPFEVDNWNSTQTKLAAGIHQFVFKVTDMAGNTGQAGVNLDVEPPITVKITNLTAGEIVGKPVSISADVVPLKGITVQKVEFSVDGKVIASPTVPPYVAVWDPTNYSAGPHSISVTAYDSQNLFTAIQKVTVISEVGSYSWVIPVVLVAFLALIIPFALRAQRRSRRPKSTPLSGGQPRLREVEGMNPGQVWPLGGSEVRLGRKRDENDIPLKGLTASRHHASITYEGGNYTIASLSPDNPVIINNLPITDRQVLRPGDTIQLGETTLRYEQ